jgi:hypothetical protein
MIPSAHADVTVAVTNPGGSRAVFVEDLLGNALTTLDFGAGNTKPFRVRVVDTTMDRAGFQVNASMSNLYLAAGGSTYDYSTSVPSSAVSLGYPGAPLTVQGLGAVLTPVFDLAETVTGTLCTAIQTAGAPASACTIAVRGVQGARQTVSNLPVDLSSLTSLAQLPLVPQTGETGAFGNPAYAGIGDFSGKPSSPPAATARRLVGGTLGTTMTMLQLKVATTPVTTVVDPAAVTAALRTALGTVPAGAVFDLLSSADQQGLVNGLVATAEALLASQVAALTGTYLSFPILNVAVPRSAPAGTYRGTMVVTTIQL